MNPSSESAGIGSDGAEVLIRRCASNLTAATQRVERNPSRAAVHAVRVAVRRLRSLLRAFRKDLHPILYAGVQFDLKNLARSLGTLRDVSVRWSLLQEMRRPPHDRDLAMTRQALGRLVGELGGAERSVQTEARQLLRSGTWSERTQRIRDALSSTALLAVRPRAQQRVGLCVLGRSLARVAKRLRGNATTQRELHRLRLAVKQARYLTDVLGEAPGSPDRPPCVGLAQNLRKLQNCLGDINDHYGLREWTLTAVVEASTRRALVRDIDVRIALRMSRFQRLRKKLREPIKESAIALLASGD